MTNDSRARLRAGLGAAAALAIAFLLVLHPVPRAGAAPAEKAAPAAGKPAPAASAKDTTPTEKDLLQPLDVAKMLDLPDAKRPALVHVGFKVLYDAGHIAGSTYAGPCSTPRGRAALTKLLKTMPKDRDIVLYCGCCPWDHCPNVNPAFRVARSLGYKNAKIMFVSNDMEHDWVNKGLPALVQ
ncbi:MAG: rhodanese-like domain-containing protein [Bacteroidota bacterium]